MKYSQFTIGCKGNLLTPANLEPEIIKEASILNNESSTLSFKQVRHFNRQGAFRYVKKESEFVSQVFTVVSSPDENVRIVQTTSTGVCWSALVIRSIDSYSDSQEYHLIPKTVNRAP